MSTTLLPLLLEGAPELDRAFPCHWDFARPSQPLLVSPAVYLSPSQNGVLEAALFFFAFPAPWERGTILLVFTSTKLLVFFFFFTFFFFLFFFFFV